MAQEMTFAASQGISAVTSEELGVQLTGAYVDPPAELVDHVATWTENIKSMAAERVAANAMGALGEGIEAGGPITGLSYEYWDILSISPVQFILPPFGAFRPHKIIAAGQPTILTAVLFINPLASPGGGPSATQYLGSRSFRVRFEQINLTTVTDGPDATFVGTFTAPAPVITVFNLLVSPADPGPNPHLMELNVTADVTDAAQPFGAFGTHWIDIESDPGFPVSQPGGLRYQTPLRYLVYSTS